MMRWLHNVLLVAAFLALGLGSVQQLRYGDGCPSCSAHSVLSQFAAPSAQDSGWSAQHMGLTQGRVGNHMCCSVSAVGCDGSHTKVTSDSPLLPVEWNHESCGHESCGHESGADCGMAMIQCGCSYASHPTALLPSSLSLLLPDPLVSNVMVPAMVVPRDIGASHRPWRAQVPEPPVRRLLCRWHI